MKITDLVNFEIEDDSIQGSYGTYHFYRVVPPNLSTMNPGEKRMQIAGFQGVLDSNEIPLQILAMDKTEDLSKNKKFWKSISPEFEYISSAILDEIGEIEYTSSGIQRAYFFVIAPREREQVGVFENLLTEKGFRFHKVERPELITVMKNFLLRDFVDFDIYTFEQEVEQLFQAQKKGRQRKGLQSKGSIFSSELTQRLLPQKMVFKPRVIEQGGFLRRVILVKNFPATIENEFILTSVAQIKNTTFSVRLVPMSPTKTAQLVDRQINNAIAAGHEKKGSKQIAAEIDVESIRNSYNDFLREKGRFYYVNIYIEVYAEDEQELRERVKSVMATLAGNHITAQELIYEQKEGFVGVSPIGKDTLTMSANNIPSNTLANMYPFSYSSRNDPEGMLLGKTRDGGYMFLDLWQRDQIMTSGNFIITGETGFGKSWLMKKIMSQQAAIGSWVFCFDPESEYNDLTREMGGTVINCATGRFIINPFEIRRLKTKEDEEDELDSEIEAFQTDVSFYQHLSWLKDFYRVLFPAITGREISALAMLTKDMYIRYGIDHTTDLSVLKGEDYPTFTDLYDYIEGVKKDRKTFSFYHMIPDSLLDDLLLMLREAYDGSLSPLFNGHTKITNSQFINFNVQELLTGSEDRTQAALFNILTYLWGRILKKEHHIAVLIDELYLIMNAENPVIAKYLRSFIKRARKYEAVIGTATQQLADLDDEKIRHITSAIINSTAIKFLFNPGDLAFERTKGMLKLTEGEADSIYGAERGQSLVKVGRHDNYNVNIGKLPYEEELFGSAGGR